MKHALLAPAATQHAQVPYVSVQKKSRSLKAKKHLSQRSSSLSPNHMAQAETTSTNHLWTEN